MATASISTIGRAVGDRLQDGMTWKEIMKPAGEKCTPDNQVGYFNRVLRPSSDVVLLPCRTKLQFGSTVARQEIYSDSDVVPESNQIQGLLEPRNNSPPNSPREGNLARTY